MDFSLSDEEKAIRQATRDFINREVKPYEPIILERERRGEKALERSELRELQLKAREFGFWGLATPEKLGGMDLSAVMQSLIWTEIGRSFVPFRFGGEADNILFFANDEQREEFLVPTIEGERISCFALTEPDAGSDAANITFSARRDGDDWILNGEKTFITNGNDADFAIVIAVTDRKKDVRDGGSTAFLVDRAMGWTSSPLVPMGPNVPAALSFQDVRVPNRNILGEVGQGFQLAMKWIGKGRYIIPSYAVGIAEGLLKMGVEYSNIRQTFGKPIGENQAIAWMLADSATEIEAARWLTLNAAWVADQGMDPRHTSSMAKLNSASMVNQVVDRVMQIHGGMGYMKELAIERWYRQVRLFRIFEGTDEMQRLILSRNLLRGYEKVEPRWF
ncbi:acyl-CoA dehydrogenase family protein [Microbacterium sp. A93]|uniref:acyl-CoA dehydrogenase family protein n=1 Tax=Microbacterium sp. A93 TaxID=3450716 RepID=UPI003F42B265